MIGHSQVDERRTRVVHHNKRHRNRNNVTAFNHHRACTPTGRLAHITVSVADISAYCDEDGAGAYFPRIVLEGSHVQLRKSRQPARQTFLPSVHRLHGCHTLLL